MSTATAPKVIAEPGDEIMSGNTSDPEAAIVAAQQGRARRVLKPKPIVPEAVVERPDTLRPLDAPVNAKREMSYEDAMVIQQRLPALLRQRDLIDSMIQRLREQDDGFADSVDANFDVTIAKADSDPQFFEKIDQIAQEKLARQARLQAKRDEIDAQIPKKSALTERGWFVFERPVPTGARRV